MSRDVLATAASLTDAALLTRLHSLAGNERETLAELLGHLAELDTRKSLYAAEGYGSLFAYCTRALHFSEDAAYNRIEAARACRRFPVILDLVAEGSLTLTAVRMVARHLTAENHSEVLAAAKGKRKVEIEALVARLAPQPDLPTSIRKLPTRVDVRSVASNPSTLPTSDAIAPSPAIAPTPAAAAHAVTPAPRRPVIHATAPERYRLELTIDAEAHDDLRWLQDSLARETGGDAATILRQALADLREKVQKAKMGKASRPGRSGTTSRRFETSSTRAVPAEVREAVWRRDGGRCAFVSSDGVRCPERRYLELHHLKAYAVGGPATVDNISLRCRMHNVHEAEILFAPIRAARQERAAAAP